MSENTQVKTETATKKIKLLRRFNQNYKNFSFSDPGVKADEEFVDLVVEMDDKGHVISESKFGKDGELEERNSYEYNSEGRLLSHTLYYALDDVTEKRVLTRNEKGNLLSEVKYYGDDSGERTEYTYNDKDEVSRITQYDEEGVLAGYEDIMYDDSGSISERITYGADEKMTGKIAFRTAEDKSITETDYDDSGNMISKTVIQFNDKGKEVSSVQTTPDGKVISSMQNSYDENGNIIERKQSDFYSKLVRYEYDEHNRLVVQELFDGSGILLRKNIYTYDEEGNLTTEQTYEMDTTRGGRDKHFGTRYEYEFNS